MKTYQLKKLFALLLLSVLFHTGLKAQAPDALDEYILDKMKDHQLPGVGIAIVKDGKIALTKGYGYANLDKDIPYTPNTIQGVGSISKTITATAIMKLWEQGLFQLDDTINAYLPFLVTNPFYPNTPITFRMLINHTSSIISVDDGLVYQVPPGTAEDLGSFLQSILVPGGSLYSASISYYPFQPGTQYAYSNRGYALLGYLVEQISGMPFNEYCNQFIFQPLCMNNTAWYYSELDTNIISRPYSFDGNHIYDYHFFEFPEYPAGQLNSTVIDMSRFMLMHLNYGILDGTRIIDSTTEVMMRTIQSPIFSGTIDHDNQFLNFQQDECLGLEHVTELSNNNEEIYGHHGGGAGVNCNSWFNISENTVVTVFSNEVHFTEQLLAVMDIHIQLDEFVADTIATAGTPGLNCTYVFNPCEHSISYWTNNSSLWSFSALPMMLGTKHYYHQQQLLDLFNLNVNGDASIVLAKELIAAKLNVAQGSELSPIVLRLHAAMNLLEDKHIPYNNPVSFSSSRGIQMLALADTLQMYNAGSLNISSCSAPPSSYQVKPEEIHTAESALSVSPNPISTTADIALDLHERDKIFVGIYDISGRLVSKLAHDAYDAGEYTFEWNSEGVTPGIYYLRFDSNRQSLTRTLIITK